MIDIIANLFTGLIGGFQTALNAVVETVAGSL